MSCIACVGGRIGHCDCKPMSADKPLSDEELLNSLKAEIRLMGCPDEWAVRIVGMADRLRARNRKLVEAAEASALLIGLGEDATERYETLAEAFYRETGKMAPGKSVPLAMAMNDDAERRRTWDHWMSAKLAACRGLLRAAIEENDDGE